MNRSCMPGIVTCVATRDYIPLLYKCPWRFRAELCALVCSPSQTQRAPRPDIVDLTDLYSSRSAHYGFEYSPAFNQPFLRRTCKLTFPTARVSVGLVFPWPPVLALMALSHDEPSQHCLTRRLKPAPHCIWSMAGQ